MLSLTFRAWDIALEAKSKLPHNFIPELSAVFLSLCDAVFHKSAEFILILRQKCVFLLIRKVFFLKCVALVYLVASDYTTH